MLRRRILGAAAGAAWVTVLAFFGAPESAAAAPSTHRTLIPAVSLARPAGLGPAGQPDLPAKVLPTPTAPAAPTPLPAGAPACGPTLQALVDAAPSGGTVVVPPCLYRETVEVSKPLTLQGQPGAEIRGSDVWADGWQREGSHWVRGTLPRLDGSWPCEENTARCSLREQLFLDGRPLEQVEAAPGPGEFSVDARRRVLLADDPRGRAVEVATRERWLRTAADGVTISGFRMRHAASRAQDGAISNDGYSNWTLRDSVLSDAAGGVVDLSDGAELRLLGNSISRGGQLGLHGSEVRGALIQGNQIFANNTEAFDDGWEAGGLKITESVGVTFDANEVHDNIGPGVWFDVENRDVVVSNNRVHHNRKDGIFYEISYGPSRIVGNHVWENGWPGEWGYGAGILVSASSGVEVDGNVVAWNSRGISVISQERGGPDGVWNRVRDVHVHDNVVVMSGDGATGLGWYQDFDGTLYEPGANNRGERNRFWFGRPEPTWGRFEWKDVLTKLADFNATPGEEGGLYLTSAETDQLLLAARLPLRRGA